MRSMAVGKLGERAVATEGEGTYYEMWMKQLESDREKVAEKLDSPASGTSADGLRQRQTATFIDGNGKASPGIKPSHAAGSGRTGGSGNDTGAYHSRGGAGGGFH